MINQKLWNSIKRLNKAQKELERVYGIPLVQVDARLYRDSTLAVYSGLIGRIDLFSELFEHMANLASVV